MKRVLLTILSISLTFALNGTMAQEFPSDFWHKGKVVLVSGDTLTGQLKYDLNKDLVQVENNNKIITFGAQKTLYFEIFDVTTDSYRQFYSLPYATTPGYKIPIFFEVVFEGKLTLLCREFITKQTSHYNSYYFSGSGYSRNVLDYEFYFLKSNGEIIYFPEKKRELLDIMRDKYTQIKQFIKEYNLKIDEKGHLARITAYYNGLIES